MHVIWNRLNDTGKNWQHVYKGLTVLGFLVGHGSERVIDEIREHAYQIQTLANFQYIDSSGRDQGSNVGRNSQSLVALVNDKEKVQEVRQEALLNRDKFCSTFSTRGRYGDRYDDDRSKGRYRDSYDGRYKDNDRNGSLRLLQPGAPSMAAFASSAIKTLDSCHFLHHRCRLRFLVTSASSPSPSDEDDLISRICSSPSPNPNPNPTPNPNPNPNPYPDPPKTLSPLQYQSLLMSLSRSNHPDHLLHLFHQMKSSPFYQPNLFVFTTVVNALVSSHRFQEADLLFRELTSFGIVPDTVCCTVLLKLYSLSESKHQFNWVYGFIRSIARSGTRLDVTIYSTLITGLCNTGRVDEAVHVLFHEMKEENCVANVMCYSTVFDALVREGRYWEAKVLFDEMVGENVMPDGVMCTNLVKMHCAALRFDYAREVVRKMRSSWGCKPDVVLYSAFVCGLCREGRIEEAREVIEEMVEGKCVPNCHTWTPLIQAYCEKGMVKEAERVLEGMERGGCRPDSVAYNVFIHGLCEKGDLDGVEKVFRESSVKGWEPDAVSYNSYMNGLCKAGRMEDAFRVFDVMVEKGVSPTVVTLNILLDRDCRESRVWEAKLLLERSSELGLEFDVVSYNTVMSRLCEVEEWLGVLKLFTDMFKKGFQPDTRSVNIVIYTLCKAGNFRKAKCIFESKEFVPDIVSCNILMHQYLLVGKMDEFTHLIAYMQKNDIFPDTVTYNMSIDSLCRDGKHSEAIHFFQSLQDVYSQEVIAHLTHGLVKGGRIADLLRLFEELLDKGLVLDCQVYDFMISAFCQKGSCNSNDIYKISLILEKMLGV